MKDNKLSHWRLYLAFALVLFSTLIYFVHFLIFKDAHHIMSFLVSDIAFVPLEVMLVTFIIHKILESRERQDRLKKMNMVIGTFFSEVGTALLKKIVANDSQQDILIDNIAMTNDWDKQYFLNNLSFIKNYSFKIQLSLKQLGDLKEFLAQKKDFLLSLLGNSNLLEHDSFSDLLWAIFHLAEELASREDLDTPKVDQKHLLGDIRRVYASLIYEWLYYLDHLREDYPYLFSLAIRTSPLRKDASPIVS